MTKIIIKLDDELKKESEVLFNKHLVNQNIFGRQKSYLL